MNNRIDIQNELKELNSQLPFEKGPEVYSVPQGYFEDFAASVLERLKTENTSSASEELEILAPFLARIPKTIPFSVPEGYFTHTTEELSDWVKEDNLPEILQSGREMPYQVPVGYFETLPGIMLKKVNPVEAKVIPISSSRKWMRYAVAALIAGAISVSSILYFGNNQSIDPASQPHEWVETKLKNVPDKALEEFINTTDISTTAIAKTETVDKTEVRRLIKDIPDTELDKFLNEVSIDNDELSAYN
jgi:hypothetical protein